MKAVYPINDMYPCIQGEGAMAGTPMVLVRLQGCPVGCPFCDTKETWRLDPDNERPTFQESRGQNPLYAMIQDAEIVALVERFRAGGPWVLVTGGEPSEYDMTPLVQALHGSGFKVAVETSGIGHGCEGAGFDWICLSPKLLSPHRPMWESQLAREADEIKMVVGKAEDVRRYDRWLESLREKPRAILSVQPVFGSRAAYNLCVQLCMVRGWRLSLQTHRFMDAR
jgi:7-carboxy-7-deazaguanine synthase